MEVCIVSSIVRMSVCCVGSSRGSKSSTVVAVVV